MTFWTVHQVAHFEPTVTAEESLAAMRARNEQYPGMLTLMPVNMPGRTVLDFGCGPGHDTLGFLLAGAEHVYAADISPTALRYLSYRLAAHGFADRATLIHVPEDGDWRPPQAEHVHAAGVLHHCTDPVRTLRILRRALAPGAEIRAMVYSSESWFFRVECKGDRETFRLRADGGAPIVRAWSKAQVRVLARRAGLTATYLGSYRHAEPEGPGLSSCWSFR